MTFVSKGKVKLAFNFVYVLFHLGYILFIIDKRTKEENSKMQEIVKW